jgi:site-specific DNA-cytosine methylase
MAGNSGGGKEPVKIRDVISVDKEKKQLTIKEATKKGYTTIEDGDCFDMTFPNSKTRRGRNMKHKSNCLTAANYDYMRYEHSDEDKEVYWRKLTPVECERLQTVPDNYTNHVSNTQRYKMLGNGWTIEVITHILKNMELPNDQTCDKSGT